MVDQMQITTTYDDEAYHSQQESALKRGMIELSSTAVEAEHLR
jgi:hypothetical protein